MSRNYEQLGIVEFGLRTIQSKDLDPVYTTLINLVHTKKMTPAQVKRWLVAYWSFYSCGLACYLAEREGADFWSAYQLAVENNAPAPHGGRWERGHERRHFRGDNAWKAMIYLRANYLLPEEMVDFIAFRADNTRPLPYSLVAQRTRLHVGFGPWIAWKVADMLNALSIAPVDFSGADLSMYRDPVKGAKMLWAETFPPEVPPAGDKEAITWAVDHLREKFSHVQIPHAPGNPIGLEEIETVLCKWKSHRNGHYPLGNDIREIRAGLLLWEPYSASAGDFYEHMPPMTHGG